MVVTFVADFGFLKIFAVNCKLVVWWWLVVE